MALREASQFARAGSGLSAWILEQALVRHRRVLNDGGWVYCGYAPLGPVTGVNPPIAEVDLAVDNAFRLGPALGFERVRTIVTTGFRTSRFAPILFWEALHALAPGGTWIDVDDTSRTGGTPLIAEDFLERAYFRACLTPELRRQNGPCVVQVLRKTAATTLSARVDDKAWTFGILTSGPSERAARMISAILALDLPAVEVIVCGPRPAGASDDRVRTIDLDIPEPRGWITRKKNLIAAAARHENLCLLHDRFVITPEWASALGGLGPAFSFVTFPQTYFADRDRRFSQRYADYQVVLQSRGVREALTARVFAGQHVLYPAYDDFHETAFCCGGLYVAKRSLWNQVRQDEALYHCEWEDIVFGLECQRAGMPHRLSRVLTVESVTPHPMALTRMHAMAAPGQPLLGHLHVSSEHERAARQTPSAFKPIVGGEKHAYYGKVIARFNAMPGLSSRDRLHDADVASCSGLADFWRTIEAKVRRLPLSTRDQMTQVLYFLSDCIYNWPNCEIQAWLDMNERVRRDVVRLDAFEHVVGWGTGSLFKVAHRGIGRELAFVVDSRESSWHTTADGLPVRPPEALLRLDPHRTLVVVFSCFVDEIRRAAQALGPFTVIAAADVNPERPFWPLTDMVRYFEEAERFYPVIFAAPSREAAA